VDSDDLLYVFLIVLIVPPLTFFLLPVIERVAKRLKR
jgi:hypothetical protein